MYLHTAVVLHGQRVDFQHGLALFYVCSSHDISDAPQGCSSDSRLGSNVHLETRNTVRQRMYYMTTTQLTSVASTLTGTGLAAAAGCRMRSLHPTLLWCVLPSTISWRRGARSFLTIPGVGQATSYVVIAITPIGARLTSYKSHEDKKCKTRKPRDCRSKADTQLLHRKRALWDTYVGHPRGRNTWALRAGGGE